MKKNCYALIFLALLIASCGRAPKQVTGQNEKAADSTTQTNDIVDTHGINEAELTDRTVKENIFDKPGYDGGNGTLIKYSVKDGISTWLRTFNCEFAVDAYSYPEKQFLYKNPESKEIVSPFYANAKLTSSQILVKKWKDKEQVECWFKVTDSKGNTGWVYGEDDPYADDNWIVIGTVPADNKNILIRKYINWFSVQRGEPAYDKPSYSGKVIWHTGRADDNSQINLEAICVTDDANKEKNKQEPWVKAKDSFGRIGWFPGEKLDIERGGPKYLSPENISSQIFEGYD